LYEAVIQKSNVEEGDDLMLTRLTPVATLLRSHPCGLC